MPHPPQAVQSISAKRVAGFHRGEGYGLGDSSPDENIDFLIFYNERFRKTSPLQRGERFNSLPLGEGVGRARVAGIFSLAKIAHNG